MKKRNMVLKIFLSNKKIYCKYFLKINYFLYFCFFRSFKLNITKFKISGKNEFNVAKSHYDKDTKRYELHLKYEGPLYLEGTYNMDTRANISVFGIDWHQSEYEFKIQSFPFIMKIGWTFGTNETTKKLLIKDFEYEFEPIEGQRFTFDEVGDFVDISPESFINVRENIWPIAAEVFELGDKSIKFLLNELLKMAVEDFDTVESFAEIFDIKNPQGLYGFIPLVADLLCLPVQAAGLFLI